MSFRLSLIACFLLVFPATASLYGAEKQWHVGFAQANIVPPDLESKTYYMGGWGEDKPVQGVFDPVWIRAIYLDPGQGQKVVLASVDHVGIRYNHIINIRKALEDLAQKNNISIHIISTHNHAGLDTIGIWGPPGKTGRDDAYLAWFEKTAAETVQKAVADAKPGKIFGGQIMASGMVVDDSPPRVPNEQVSVLRFVPDDKNARPTWLLHFSCHPEGLGKPNSHLSSDFVHATREKIEQTKNCNTLYINGAVGSMQTVPRLFDENGRRSQPQATIYKFGRDLADYYLAIDQWTEISPELLFKTKVISLPIYNEKLIGAAKMGLILPFIPGEPRTSPPEMLRIARKDPTQQQLPTSITEVSYMRLGDSIGVVFIPGELAPELANGKYLEPDDCVNPEMPTEKPLFEIMPDRIKLIIGLANDEIGYILPANNYYISETKPWVPADDKFGRGHYPETNGTGPETPTIIAETLEELVK